MLLQLFVPEVDPKLFGLTVAVLRKKGNKRNNKRTVLCKVVGRCPTCDTPSCVPVCVCMCVCVRVCVCVPAVGFHPGIETDSNMWIRPCVNTCLSNPLSQELIPLHIRETNTALLVFRSPCWKVKIFMRVWDSCLCPYAAVPIKNTFRHTVEI